jgi:cation diffusion facilitator CzcD-associated flavoprotein CzcO
LLSNSICKIESELKLMNKKSFKWAVIGAGPAGIAAVGKLLDQGISPNHILWIDPHFKVGDLGTYWNSVSSNTKVKYFKDFLMEAQSFNYKNAPIEFKLNDLPEQDTCTLSYIVEPLQWITNCFLKKVNAIKTSIHTMFLSDRKWTLLAAKENYSAQNVILATGAKPSSLDYSGINVIAFDKAIDKEKLKAIVDPNKTYGVFGSSHSAIIIVRYLVELGVQKVINFYRSPCRYAIEMGDWILFDNTGLKGQTATWARENIDGILPKNLVRYTTTQSNITRFLPECDQVIYAVGFKQRQDIVIGDYEKPEYNPHVGIIGPGLFGFGIAYPEIKTDPLGNVEFQVGLWKFMVYLNKIMPIWFKYPA